MSRQFFALVSAPVALEPTRGQLIVMGPFAAAWAPCVVKASQARAMIADPGFIGFSLHRRPRVHAAYPKSALIGTWSEGFSAPRNALSIATLFKRSAA